jgi:hypothetical protein
MGSVSVLSWNASPRIVLWNAPLQTPPPPAIRQPKGFHSAKYVYIFCNVGTWASPQYWVLMLGKFKLQDLEKCGIFCQLPKCARFFITGWRAKLKILSYFWQCSIGRPSNRRNNNVTVIRVGTYKCPPTNCTSVFNSDLKFTFYFISNMDMFLAAEHTEHRTMEGGHITRCTKGNNNTDSHHIRSCWVLSVYSSTIH